MRKKNQMAEMALIALNVFLTTRVSSPELPDRDRRAAALALEMLRPFTVSAEKKVYERYGSNPFPPCFFIDLLKVSVDEEWERRIKEGEDLRDWADADCLMKPFLDMADELLNKLSIQLHGRTLELN